MSEKLYQIISEVFSVDVSRIDENTSPENLEQWDSFNFYVLLNEIEKKFNIQFDIDETLEIKKIGDFKKLFEKKGVEI
ncbi:MAG: acyl carrier protein [Chloroflexi bacterium]|nr:acyl carrier protein [Chloroflexota bacterium]|tara:strand:+ start:1782 stop:2015 length:234 start_codon:yes stop_codon:yes gene_type:complete